MKNVLIAGLGLVMAWGVVPARAGAQSLQNALLRTSFDPVGSGARATGMGGAFIAVADDGTAASFNPAGLAQLRRSELAFVSFSDGLSVDFKSIGEGDFGLPLSRTDRKNVPEFLGLAIPFEVGTRHLTFQLSYQRVVDLKGEGFAQLLVRGASASAGSPETGDAAYAVDTGAEQSGGLHTISASAGYEVTDRLSLGLSVNSWLGSWSATGSETSRSGLPAGSALGGQEDRWIRFTQKHKLDGLNLNMGFLLHYPHLSLGGILRLPFSGNYRLVEQREETVLDAGSERPLLPQEIRMNSRLRWPRSGGLGAAWRPLPKLTLAADFSYAEWSRAVIEDVPNGALLTEPILDATGQPAPYVFLDRSFFDLRPATATLTRNTTQWRFGSEYLLTARRVIIPLRLGFFMENSPVTDLGTLDSRRLNGATAGIGLNFNRLALDLAFERRTGSAGIGMVYDRGPQPGADIFPTEDIVVARAIGSIIVRFGRAGDDPLKRLLRAIFVGE